MPIRLFETFVNQSFILCGILSKNTVIQDVMTKVKT
jgi:hypothetical protein